MTRLLLDSEKRAFIQGKEAELWAGRRHKDQTLEVLPGVYSNEEYSYFLVHLFEVLHSYYLRNAGDEYGRLNTDFDVLLNLAGHPMNPLGVPAPIARRDDEVDDQTRKVHRAVCQKLTTAGPLEPLPLQIAKMSQSSIPFYSHDLTYKAKIIHFWAHEYSKIRKAWQSDGLAGLSNLGIYIMYAISRRMQYDGMKETEFSSAGSLLKAVPKARMAYTEKGDHVQCDKTLGPSFSDKCFRLRAREVWGMSGTFNYAWQMPIQSIRNNYMHKYAHLLHHISIVDSVGSFPQGRGCVTSFDFKEFDHSIRAEFQNNWIDAVEQLGVDPVLCEMRRFAVTAPAIFHNGSLDQGGLYITHDYRFDSLRGADFGVQSGIADVADIDKSVGVAVVCDIGFRSGILRYEEFDNEIDKLMTDCHPLIRLRNMGDDTLLWFDNETLLKQFSEAAAKYKSFKVELDKQPVFLGHTLVRRGSDFYPLPNVARGLANVFVPERAISHSLKQGRPRAFWAFGLTERNEYYRRHPLWDDIWNIALQEVSKWYKRDFATIIQRNAIVQEKEAYAIYKHLSVYDMLFLNNPSYISYRLQPTDVSRELLDSFYLSVPSEEVGLFLKEIT